VLLLTTPNKVYQLHIAASEINYSIIDLSI